ncbi:MAG: hypothetical protein AB7T03_02635 [Bacilli bacterium]
MVKKRILKKVFKKEITTVDAYNLLYSKKTTKAHFIKLHIKIQDHPWVSSFVNLLFFFPFPISLLERILLKVLNEKGAKVDYQTFKYLLNYCNGTEINVIADEAIIKIEIF